MNDDIGTAARAYARATAPADVLATLDWLDAHGFAVAAADREPGVHMGNVWLAYERAPAVVRVTCDRGQWYLDVGHGSDPDNFDVVYAATAAAPSSEAFPDVEGLCPQRPPGVAWRESLPTVLEWLAAGDTASAIALADDQRHVRMWPDSHRARNLLRQWSRGG
ncbi:MAG: hypothetical protein ACT4QF_00040 [Sporichthyaceae bacterium]